MSAHGRQGATIEVQGLTKRFGTVVAIDDLEFTVSPGRVTGFLGPNGAGKTTTLRILLGLVAPSAGTATIGGRRYQELDHPLSQVGALLEATSFHPSRRALDHLRMVAMAAGIDQRRAGAVLDLVGLSDVANRRVAGFSLGMRQRLSLATALLGDPAVLVLDEPSNGLDPAGIAWLREFLRFLANEGRTVLVSSHLLAEMALTLDDVVIISGGTLRAQGPLSALTSRLHSVMRVRTPEPDRLVAVLEGAAIAYRRSDDGAIEIEGIEPEQLGPLLAASQVVLYELVRERSDLESLFLSLTAGAGGDATHLGGRDDRTPGAHWRPASRPRGTT